MALAAQDGPRATSSAAATIDQRELLDSGPSLCRTTCQPVADAGIIGSSNYDSCELNTSETSGAGGFTASATRLGPGRLYYEL
jgi:hypothetical protein